jgi:sialidase-1
MFFEEYNLYEAGDAGYHECRIPALLTTTKGTILAFNEARKFTGRDTDQIDLFLRRSFDGGKSFEKVQLVASLEGWVTGNPAPVQDRETGVIWLLLTRNRMDGDEAAIVAKSAPRSRSVWVTSSSDDGATWSDPEEITSSVKRSEWTWYATGPGHGIQLRSGRLVIPCDHIAYERGDRKTDPYHSHIIYSDDHGANWQIGGISDEGSNECMVVETVDGWLYLNSRNKGGTSSNFRRVSWSCDGGGPPRSREEPRPLL